MLDNLLGYISKTKLFGIIPLDILAHLFFGIVIFIVLKNITKKAWLAFTILIAIAVIKEYIDSFRLNATNIEHLKDILVTMSYPALSILISKIKTRK